eukprot:CAMPEP_0181294968 /NCGR_PEP_ID=MMETSP1101-20121128/3889_1 /TAXON_ID=46948 /ORGANISM="Rhodomonas abbreviata, Strain Caron Lab Isolate" /LENGTH=229 /DNA_ID=CAMNT_0023399673 /DNA_START=15 /DNA_END=704 /DNA_ORIENTATION=-
MQRLSSRFFFLAFVALSVSLVAGVEKALPHFVESVSGTQFPLEIAGESETLDLAGAAIRVKKILFVHVQVYAVGLYVSLPKVAAAVGKTDVSGANPKLFEDLVANDIPMALRLVMLRTVGGDQMSSALGEALQPRITAIQTDEEEGKSALKQFEAQFDSELSTGSELLFEWREGNVLHTTIAGEWKGAVQSSSLARALFSVFLDADAVVERASIVTRLPLLLSPPAQSA